MDESVAEGSVGVLVVCPDCSEVRVAPDAVTLRICMDDASWSYWFVCPMCGRRAAAGTRPGPALEAISEGAPFQSWWLPAELFEPHDGPVLQVGDLIDLLTELEKTDAIEVPRDL
jgi:hypothetical protein